MVARVVKVAGRPPYSGDTCSPSYGHRTAAAVPEVVAAAEGVAGLVYMGGKAGCMAAVVVASSYYYYYYYFA